MTTASGRAFARAALAGNPSDGYGGAVLAVVVSNFCADVHLRAGPGAGATVDPPSPLVQGTIEGFAREHGVGTNVSATWTTTIPREVGLAGSSAIVIATARALCDLHAEVIEAAALATFALAVEERVLHIRAGLQDRVAQAYNGLTYMDFAPDHPAGHGAGRYESLDASLLPPLYLAYRADAPVQSGAVHGPLHERFRAGDPHVVESMAALAAHARAARDALLAGNADGFARCVNASFDVRERLVDLHPHHVAMVRRARSLGASANYTGSGGAVVGSCRDENHREEVLAGMRADGCVAVIPAL